MGKTYCELHCADRPRQINGLGNTMRICTVHYEELFAKGRIASRDIARKHADWDGYVFSIMTRAHAGLARLKRTWR